MRTHMILLLILITGCQKLDHIGQPPAFSEPSDMSFQATSTQLDTSSCARIPTNKHHCGADSVVRYWAIGGRWM